jgi:hypothetical protein
MLRPLVCHPDPSFQFEYSYAWSVTKRSSRSLFWKQANLNPWQSLLWSLTCSQSNPPAIGCVLPRIEWWMSLSIWIDHVQQYHWDSKELARNRKTQLECSLPVYSTEAVQQWLARCSHCRRWRWDWYWCHTNSPARLTESEHTQWESPE